MISSSIQRLLATPVLHSSFSLQDQYVGLKVDHVEDQVNLKSKWALNRNQFYGRVIAAFFGGFSRVQRSRLDLMSQFTGLKTCVTSISSSSPASHQCKQTAAAWQPLLRHILDCLTQSRRGIRSSPKYINRNKNIAHPEISFR